MHKFRWGAIALGLAAICQPTMALEPYVVYDAFSATSLDITRWSDSERGRSVVSGQLRLAQRDRGLNSQDTDRVGNSWSDALSRGGPVTQLRSLVRVQAYDMTGCAANATPTRVRARLLGTFFNSGNRVVGSNIGDVLAQIFIYRDSNSVDPAGQMRIQGTLLMCTSSDCNLGTNLAAPVSLGTINTGQNVVLQVEWDRANKRFIFGRDYNATTAEIAYTVDDSLDPGNLFKSVGTRTDVANCTATASTAFIDARFDSVTVNSSAKP